ncbi:glutathione S-transferase T3-like [Tripterygium wilfordii]|uniref:glutathione S-transferase T3-like n=1 Tax=Tripterygium wilfordii TaxID=458696 RepID=UPI0018F7F2D5|nr:glutathione S-transferase T3-like [Tripterygium wilfordii]
MGSKKKTTNRGVNFSIEEDKNLVSAWLNTSIDAVQGTDQKAKTFWSRITTTYNATKGSNHKVCTDRSLSSRWAAIQLAVNKFCGFLTQVEDSRPSGTTEIDKEFVEAPTQMELAYGTSFIQEKAC